MAQMYPEWIDEEHRRSNPKFRAEFKVYDALAESLGDPWTVFYSRTWSWVERGSRLRTREADFIIAHPDIGILIMEVKGGGITVRDGQWSSRDRYGKEHNINPFDQVAIATRSLERRLAEERLNPFKGFRFCTAVCFPDINCAEALPQLDEKHLSVVVDAAGLDDLPNSLLSIFKDNSGSFSPPGESRIAVLKHLVACSWYINAPKHIQITDTEEEIKKLTTNQFKLLYQLAPSADRLLVSGCAGSGKTMLAAEIARRMAQLERKRVLFTCYNRNLALWIRTSPFFVDDGHMMVTNFQQLCAEFAKQAGLDLPRIQSPNDPKAAHIFNVKYPELLLEAVSVLGEQFDAIIVDEGQDFNESWWAALQLLLHEEGSFHIYYDPRQRLTGPPESFPKDIQEGALCVDLKENVRNTKHIHDLAMRFHDTGGKGFEALCQFGVEPEFVAVEDGLSEHQAVTKIVSNLIFNEGIRASEIAILTPLSISSGESSWRHDHTLIGRYRLVHKINSRPHEIFCSSIQAAKGLEFPVVVLTELDKIQVEDLHDTFSSHMYVGISRARSHIIIMCHRKEFERFI